MKESLTNRKFENILKIIEKELFTNEYPSICSLHDISPDKDSHNCIACNLAGNVINLKDAADLLSKSTKSLSYPADEAFAEKTYILWLYLLSENIHEVLKLISYPQDIKNKDFKNTITIKRWANFLKHPKAFLLTHHPAYCDPATLPFEPHHLGLEGITIIDDRFINKFYSGDKNNKELYTTLQNNQSTLVLLPDLEILTKGIADELNQLIEKIKHNNEYSKILTDKASIEDYLSGAQADSSD